MKGQLLIQREWNRDALQNFDLGLPIVVLGA